ncbi:MAG: response regulator [bacterium]|nr:response regulator [bacterium]
MGFMQVYRVGTTGGDSALGKISRLLTGEGIDSEELGSRQPENGCVLIDLMAGEDNVRKAAAAVPQLPIILVTSTAGLGSRQLGLADELVSPDLPEQEIVRRVQCMQNLALRLVEEVPSPTQTRILLDGQTEGDDANLKGLANILKEAEIEWEPLKEENDRENTGIVYTHYRRHSYARMLQADYPGYIHIQMAQTPELRTEALTVGDISYTPKATPDEILTRHHRFVDMLDRLRNPDTHRTLSKEDSAVNVLFVGDRNVGNTLRVKLEGSFNFKTMAGVAGGIAESRKHRIVLIHLGAKEDAKERFTFLQALLKTKNHPALALLFFKPAPDQIKDFCGKTGVAIIESANGDEVPEALLALNA